MPLCDTHSEIKGMSRLWLSAKIMCCVSHELALGDVNHFSDENKQQLFTRLSSKDGINKLGSLSTKKVEDVIDMQVVGKQESYT